MHQELVNKMHYSHQWCPNLFLLCTLLEAVLCLECQCFYTQNGPNNDELLGVRKAQVEQTTLMVQH